MKLPFYPKCEVNCKLQNEVSMGFSSKYPRSEQLENSPEPAKSNRKRARPGENCSLGPRIDKWSKIVLRSSGIWCPTIKGNLISCNLFRLSSFGLAIVVVIYEYYDEILRIIAQWGIDSLRESTIKHLLDCKA